jgi:transcriptional regulator with XRE-family HTH domain
MRYGTLDVMQSPDAVATAVGRNVRALRQQHRMTIDALAAAAGVSRGTVIQIETARGNPSIGTLCNLAAALRVGVASLVDGDAAPRVVVRRGAEAAELWTSAAGSSAVFRIGTDPPDVVELWDWTLRPGDGFDGEAHPIGTQEVLLVLTGQLALRVGATDSTLDAGDTVLFQAHAPHRYACDGDVPVRFVMVVLQPGDAGLVPPTAIAEAEPPTPQAESPFP